MAVELQERLTRLFRREGFVVLDDAMFIYNT
jgi:hypothetical protein